jgi:DNA-binding LacI/PurR family transcriptional regulator
VGRATANRVTLSTLAADLGVSVTTVSNAYNKPDQLSPILRDRILARAAELGFAGPSPAGRSLRRGRVGAVGVLLGQPLSFAFSDPASVLLFDGVATTFHEHGAAMLLIPSTASAAADRRLVESAVVDAWLAYALGDRDPLLAAVVARHQPIVVLDQPEDAGLPVFAPDDEGGMSAITAHLLDLGHTEIGVVSTEFRRDGRDGLADPARQARATSGSTARRLGGVRQAMAAAGLDWERVAVFETARNDQRAGSDAALELLRDPSRPTAIVAFTDQLAFGVLHAARSLGLVVPRDLSVTGFDDVPAAEFAEPPLTTVDHRLAARGAAGATAIMAWLESGTAPRTGPRSTARLVVRKSTGAPPR